MKLYNEFSLNIRAHNFSFLVFDKKNCIFCFFVYKINVKDKSLIEILFVILYQK